MKKFLNVVKVIFYIVAILMVGQIPISKRTVGGHVHFGILTAVQWSVGKLKATELYKALGKVPVLSSEAPTESKPQLTASLSPSLIKPELEKGESELKSDTMTDAQPATSPPNSDVPNDEFSAADRASLLRLLQ